MSCCSGDTAATCNTSAGAGHPGGDGGPASQRVTAQRPSASLPSVPARHGGCAPTTRRHSHHGRHGSSRGDAALISVSGLRPLSAPPPSPPAPPTPDDLIGPDVHRADPEWLKQSEFLSSRWSPPRSAVSPPILPTVLATRRAVRSSRMSAPNRAGTSRADQSPPLSMPG